MEQYSSRERGAHPLVNKMALCWIYQWPNSSLIKPEHISTSCPQIQWSYFVAIWCHQSGKVSALFCCTRIGTWQKCCCLPDALLFFNFIIWVNSFQLDSTTVRKLWCELPREAESMLEISRLYYTLRSHLASWDLGLISSTFSIYLIILAAKRGNKNVQ
jgi:hypothetical protein